MEDTVLGPAKLKKPKKSADEEAIPGMIGGILISEVLGKGGMGVVYKGMHSRLLVPVAVKVLTNGHGSAAIIKEAQLTAKVNHPNIVRVYDVNTHERTLYIVQELIEGESLYSVIYGTKNPPSEARALEICADVARGLDAIHKHGIIHLDIKPENILISKTENMAKIVDLGIATCVQQEKDRDGGMIAGTPGFLSPERYAGDPPAVTDDLYALGATLYETLTTLPAFAAKSVEEIFEQQTRERIPDPRRVNAKFSGNTAEVIRKCLDPDMTNRFKSAAEMLDALLDARSRLSLSGPRRTVATIDPRFRSSRPIARVLCVDDDPEIRNLVAEILAPEGHTITTKEDGEAALRYLQTAQVDVVLSDVEMPRMNGLAFCKALRGIPAYKDVPVVFVSGVSDVGVITQAMGMGAVDYLIKPIKIAELTTRVRCLARLQQVNRERDELQSALNGLLSKRGLPEAEQPVSRTRKKILVSASEPDVRNSLLDYLEEHNFEVAVAINGLETVRMARMENFDLCILDGEMPELDGYDVCRELRDMPSTAELPVLFLTSKRDSVSIQRALDVGSTDVINKPPNLPLLHVRINNLLKLSTNARMAPKLTQSMKMFKK